MLWRWYDSMTVRVLVALMCLAACSTGAVRLDPVAAAPPAGGEEAGGPEAEAEASAPEAPASEPAASVVAGDPGALEIPHDMPPLDADCRTRASFAGSHVRDAIEFASAGCSVDADCVRVSNSTGCGGWCGSSVLAEHEDAYENLRSSIEERVCSTYREDGCPYGGPRCGKTTPQCVEGRCEMVL